MFVCALQVVCSIDSSSYAIRLAVVIVVNACNPSTYEVDAEGSEFEDHPWLYGGFKNTLATGDTALNCCTVKNLIIFIRFNMIEIMS